MGAGKTLFAVQTLVNGARNRGEPGFFVAFEASSRRIVTNASSFDWDMLSLANDQLYFVDAQLSADVVRGGQFEITALLAVLTTVLVQISATGHGDAVRLHVAS